MGEETVRVQLALDLYNRGDPDACNLLFAQAGQRLQQIARRMLYGGFARLAGELQTADVTQEASLRLLKALGDVKIQTPGEFFRFSAAMMRRVLIDLTRHHFGPEGQGATEPRLRRGTTQTRARRRPVRAAPTLPNSWPPGVSSMNGSKHCRRNRRLV